MIRFQIRHIAAALVVLMVALPGVALADSQGDWVKHGLSGQTYVWQAGSC